jgi:hypothetical protein
VFNRGIAAAVVLLTACSSGKPSGPAPGAPPAPVQSGLVGYLPDNPCDLATAQQVEVASGVKIEAARRVPDISEIIRAEREHRSAKASLICNYDSSADIGDITIVVPEVSQQNVAAYRKARDDYARSFRAENISGIGEDAWLSGGNTLHVLAGRNAQFIVATQYSQKNSRDVVIAVAKSILSRIAR